MEKIKILQDKEKLYTFLKDSYLSILKEKRFIYLNISGFSMYPFIKKGDKIKVVFLSGDNLSIGDIFLIDGESNLYVHRLVKIINKKDKKMYITKGDAHKNILDPVVDLKKILGRVVEIKRDNLSINLDGKFYRFINRILGFISFRYPKIIPFFSRYIDFILDKYLFFIFKLKNRNILN